MNELDYTPEELEYFEQEFQKYKLPWISRSWRKIGIPVLVRGFIFAALIIIIFSIIHGISSRNYEWMWILCKTLALFYIFVVGGFGLIAHIFEIISLYKFRKKLKVNKEEFQYLLIIYPITGL